MMPTFLHIFEPRYRLMIRRCIENGSRKFGMLMYNHHRIVQEGLGEVHYLQYGTALHIDRIEMLPDGRSLIETRGIYRFKVIGGDMLDGYNVGRIQRVDDIPIAEEEAIEARETGSGSPPSNDPTSQINKMSTQQLLDFALEFTAGARARSARWLHQRVLDAYGQPPTDPAIFPYWFASVLPIAEEEKYQLLPATSVRERLKITTRWIQRLEAARCKYEAELRTARERSVRGEATSSVERVSAVPERHEAQAEEDNTTNHNEPEVNTGNARIDGHTLRPPTSPPDGRDSTPDQQERTEN